MAGSGAIWLVVVAVVFVGGVVLRVERVVSGVCLGRWVVRSIVVAYTPLASTNSLTDC